MSSTGNVAGGGKKVSWPEVVGLPAGEAKAVILKDKPDADVIFVPFGAGVQQDLSLNRVRVFVGTIASVVTVVLAPKVG
ncbi:hypothetical protein CFC21_000958 [Triticum aestivum]|uniref:Subtilisin-chymotrypsin inhibitor-2A n=3 Tax=Triticum TaxID=4564 RepID=M8B389_TRIUA|nr:subtilisin-chymotrypsin inhibitor CI-1B-like [Triticum dicoccoides]XP_044375493.1 subtilisin-chymotrypsin inhibitor CI-1B-like [Triticum aestivum]XP_048568227.1 subtilisin-chymotrypsin inhibitor CI-1B-like [Triticum urartu]VAH02092.1 unnamed protein product [Triticum turgidum subsp. durum]EMS68019.1 Subtilisin-chymotrypsin inhibitor-2A [Triticum urartu]KAF6982577.1 hypothetical protein CFC21_000958 [Triticum aestivum]